MNQGNNENIESNAANPSVNDGAGDSVSIDHTNSPLVPGPMRHVLGLDGIRGIAVLMVLIFHTTYINRIGAFDDTIYRMTRFLDSGVDVFFVLSGFLITNILIRAKQSPTYYRDFYMRRVLRIFPLYYALVGVCFLAPLLFPALHQVDITPLPAGGLNYWLYLSNVWVTGKHPMIGVAWSLAIEEQFYMVWPFVVYVLSRKALVRVCVAMLIAGIAYRWMVFYGESGWLEHSPVARFDMLVMGALAAIWDTTGSATLAQRKKVVYTLIPLAIGTFVATVLIENGFWGNTMVVYGKAAVAALTVAVILAIGMQPVMFTGLKGVLENRLLRSFGKYSYAIYLFHSTLDAGLRRAIDVKYFIFPIAGSEVPMQIVYWIIVAAISWGAAWISWQLFESHFLKLKKRFEGPKVQADGSITNAEETKVQAHALPTKSLAKESDLIEK